MTVWLIFAFACGVNVGLGLYALLDRSFKRDLRRLDDRIKALLSEGK